MEKKFIGKSRIVDIITCMHKGYCYDTPEIRQNRSDYMTFTKKSFIYNIADRQVL